MRSGIREESLERRRRVWLGALIATAIAAVAAMLVFELPSRITLPVALGLTAVVIWTGIRERRRGAGDEIGFALQRFSSRSGNAGHARDLRHAFADHFAARRALLRDQDEARRGLAAAIAGFGRFLGYLGGEADRKRYGDLEASARFHRAASLKLLADIEDDRAAREELLERALADLVDFEDRPLGWRLLVPGALALRLRCRLALGDLDAAERDQERLDRHLGTGPISPDLLATREELADELWDRAEQALDEEEGGALRRRALAHLDAWLNLLGPGHLAARLRAARRNDAVARHDRVIAILGDSLTAPESAKRDQLEGERLLARAHLGKGSFDRALRCYSVLMSVSGPDNPWHRDPEVLREIGRAERAIAGRAPAEDEPDED